MLHDLVGKDSFRDGLVRFLERFDGSSATVSNLIDSISAECGQDLTQFERCVATSLAPASSACAVGRSPAPGVALPHLPCLPAPPASPAGVRAIGPLPQMVLAARHTHGGRLAAPRLCPRRAPLARSAAALPRRAAPRRRLPPAAPPHPPPARPRRSRARPLLRHAPRAAQRLGDHRPASPRHFRRGGAPAGPESNLKGPKPHAGPARRGIKRRRGPDRGRWFRCGGTRR